MASDRAVSMLKLFTLDAPAWTVEDAAAALGVSVSSAYRYVAALTDAGLLTAGAGGRYALGPAIIQYDRQIQLTDPLLRAAKPVMADLLRFAPAGSTVLLCRLFRETVLCVHQLRHEPASPPASTPPPVSTPLVSYERGRPMPLFRGATSKVILAHLPARDLRRLHAAQPGAIAAAGLGDTWDAFRAAMAALRRAGHVVSQAEVDPGRVGIAAPIADDRRVLGSLSYVVPLEHARDAARLASLAMGGAGEIEAAIRFTD